MRMCIGKVLIFWTGGKNVAILNVHINYMPHDIENIGVFEIWAKHPVKRDEDCAE
jgi:hypothetical protein